MAQRQIKIIDFRNARYQGQVKDNELSGTGILLDDNFTFCLAEWERNRFHKDGFIIFPNSRIFYGEFRENELNGFCCFTLGEECQIYCLAENDQVNLAVAVFPFISSVIELSLSSDQKMETSKQNLFETEEDKWEIINDILGIEVPSYYRTPHEFLRKKIVNPCPFLELSVNKRDYIFGMKGEGLKAMMGHQNSVRELGVYNDADILDGMGKKVINQEKNVIEEGFYDDVNGLTRYQGERPNKIKKTYRDYFRKSLNFQNQFLKIKKISDLADLFVSFKVSITDNTTQKIAQQIIESEKTIQATFQMTQAKNRENQSNSRNRNTNKDRQRNRVREPAQKEVSLEMLKEELNRSLSHSKNHRSRSKSPYQEMKVSHKQPPELKYTSKTIQKNMLDESLLQNRDKPKQYYEREPIDHSYRVINKDYSGRIQHNQSDQSRGRSPINYESHSKRNLLSYDRRNEDFNAKYTENPERRNEKFPQHIFANIELKDRKRQSPSPKNRANKLDRMSDMYDRLNQEKEKERERESPNRYYGNRKYYVHDEEDMYDRNMGLVRASRKNQYNSRSPYRNQTAANGYKNDRSRYGKY